ncbi:MAG: phosphoenolpyruvate carboxykinase (ATP), partial [Actinomycetota bacterium]|nr:phosphoenolpyruvate carboxykinase (ATP) [Actinomycetota bacterium]
FDDSYTANGRVTFPLANIRHRDPCDLPKASYLFILNRNADIIPAVARLSKEQAAMYFMLGETEGTSAGGAHEAGKKLRVPGTNPFWFEEESSMGNRFLELLGTCDLEVFLLNTGRIGGGDEDERSKKVSISTSAAVQGGIIDGSIEWVTDPDFGYDVAASCPGIDDVELFQPSLLYTRQSREAEYAATVSQLKTARRAYLAGFSGLDHRVARASEG